MDDLIKRQDAVNALDKRFDDVPMELTVEILQLRRDLRERIPSAEPERKTGYWIDTGSGQECSVCGEIQYGYDNGRNFCPNCGADMRGEQDENR